MADRRVMAGSGNEGVVADAGGGGLSKEVLALASEVFDRFCAANTLRTILSLHRHLCDLLRIKPTNFPQFYPKIRGRLRSWKAEAIWAKFDKRASHKCYSRGRMCPNTRVFIIGAGPCGLRTAIEAQLLGAKVVVVEKRDRISRNNVLHLWPFVIHDLRALGAKKFFGKFCAGSIDHISIRQLQCILLKCALLLGVEIHEGISFEGLRPPPEDQSDRIGWRAEVLPADHPVAQYEFDVLVGADGKRNTLEGFKRKEFRGKLAIAITVNFINKHTEAEARVQEISGVAFIFRQKFFQEMRASTGIDLENIVYYKDETHYFVMTAKKQSLLAKGVILQDYANTAKLLSPENVDREALLSYAREAANFATEGKLPHLEPAINHHNQPDVAMFDFTSLYAAENASRVVERRGHRLLMLLVGDSLTEPFWPTGSGCARGFLSSMNACWAMRSWGQLGPASIQLPTTPTLRMIESGDEHVTNGDGNKENEEGGIVTTPTNKTPKRSVYAILEVLAERESLYRLLGQVAPDNMSRDFDAYTLDPHTRYLSLNTQSVLPYQVRPLYDTDDKSALSFDPPVGPVGGFPSEHSKRRRKRDTQVHPDMLLQWLKRQVALYDGVTVDDMTRSFKDGLALCAVIHRYRPDLLDFHSLNPTEVAHNNQLAFDTLERELGIPPVMTGLEMEQCDVPDKLTMLTYLSQVYDTFRGEIPHIKHPKLQDDVDFLAEEAAAAAEAAALQQARLRKLGNLSQMQKASLITRIVSTSTGKAVPHSLATYVKRSGAPTSPSTAGASPAPSGDRSVGDTSSSSLRRTRKRRSSDKTFGTLSLERMKLQEELARNRLERQRKRQYQRQLATQRFHKSLAMLQANALRAAGSDGEESSPFQDYSILFYRMTAPSFEDRVRDLETKILYPGRRDREARIQAELRKGRSSRGGGGVNDGDFSGRVKNIEDKLKGNAPVEKRPKDLLRAIGKIEKSDWNVRQIERKMEENKMGKGANAAELLKKSERVPKWNQEKFQDKFMAVERKLMGKAAEQEAQDKYADIDRSLKHYERKLKEGLALESSGPRGANKVSAMAEQFSAKPKDESEAKADEGSADQGPAPLQKSNSRGALVVVPQGGSETCHFCGKRVYLMERLSAEGCFFHRGCFRCEYCSTMLRLGNYAFDRDGKYGSHFFCVQHFGLQGLLNGAVRIGSKSSGKGAAAGGGTKERHHARARKSGKDHMHETKADEGKAVEEKENAIHLIATPKGKSPGTGTSGRKSTGEGKRRSKGSKYGTPRIRPPPVVDPVPFLSPPYIPEEEVDLADRGTTPERIEFENSIPVATPDARNAGSTGMEGGGESALGDGGPSKKVSSVEELPQMDEEEWINRNFGASAAEDASDDEDDDSSSFSNDEAGENVEIGGIADLGEEVMERRRHSKKGEKERDNDEDEVFVEAMEEPMMTIEQTRLIAEKWKRRYSKDVVEDGGRSGESKAAGGEAQNGKTNKEDDEESSDSYESGESDDYEDEDEDEDSETATEGDEEEEGEEEAKARELRKQEFHLKVPQRPPRTGHGSGGDQGSDTEVNSEDYSTSETDSDDDDDDDEEEEEEENSATEISTDSEFDDDRNRGNFLQHEIPTIVIDESLLCGGVNGDVRLDILDPSKQKEGSAANQQQPRPSPRLIPLSRTHSTEGIASKVSLELKKRYLLGGTSSPSPPAITNPARRSILGSPAVPPAPALDSKLRCLADAISEHQKLLNPAPEPSAAMQTFLQKSSSTSDAQHQHLAQSSPLTLQKDIDSIRKRFLSDYAAKSPSNSALSSRSNGTKEMVLDKEGSGDRKIPVVSAPRQPEDLVLGNKTEVNVALSSKEKLVNGVCNKDNHELPPSATVVGNEATEPIETVGIDRSNDKPLPPKIVGEIEKGDVKSPLLVEKELKEVFDEKPQEKEQIKENPTTGSPHDVCAVIKPVEVKKVIIESEENEEEPVDSQGEWVDWRPRSPAHETSIEVPEVNWKKVHEHDSCEEDDDDEESSSEDSLQDDYYDEKDIDEAEVVEKVLPVPPVVVVEETPVDEGEAIELVTVPQVIKVEEAVPGVLPCESDRDSAENFKVLEESQKKEMEEPKECLDSEAQKDVIIVFSSETEKVSEKEAELDVRDSQILNSIKSQEEISSVPVKNVCEEKVASEPDLKRDFSVLPLKKQEDLSMVLEDEEVPTPTETEELSSDWARDTDAANSVGEDLDLELCVNPIYVNTCDRRKREKVRGKRGGRIHKKNTSNGQWASTGAKKAELEDDFTREPSTAAPPPLPSLPPPSLPQVQASSYCPEDIEFMDVGTEGSSPDEDREECQKRRRRRKGYSQLTEGSPAAADGEDEGEVTPVAEDEDDEEDSSSDTVSGVRRSRTVEAVNCIAVGLAEEEEDGFSPAQDDTTTPSDAVTTVIESQPSLLVDGEEAEESDRLGGLTEVRHSRDEEQDAEYQGHVRRLKGRVSPFSNARDSIDIRKSRKQQKSGRVECERSEPVFIDPENDEQGVLVPKESSPESSPEKCVISEGKVPHVVSLSASSKVSPQSHPPHKLAERAETSSLSLSKPESPSKSVSPEVKPLTVCNPTIIRPFVNSPSTSRKLEELSRERSKQKDLIREMVISRLGSSEGGCRRSSSSVGGERRRGRSPRASVGSSEIPSSPPTPSASDRKETTPLSTSLDVSLTEQHQTRIPEKSDVKHVSNVAPTRSLSMNPQVTPPCILNLRARTTQRRHSLHSQEPLSADMESSLDEVFSTPMEMTGMSTNQPCGGKTRPLSVHSPTSRTLSSSTMGLGGGILPDTPLTNPDAFSMPDIRRALFRTPVGPSACAREGVPDVPVRPIRRKDTTSTDKLVDSENKDVSNFDETRSHLINTGDSERAKSKSQSLTEERGIDVVLHSLGREVVDVIPRAHSVSPPTSPSRPEGTVESSKLEVDVKEGEKVILRKDGKKGSKDRERRKSIIQAVSDFFGGKKGSGSSASTTASSSTPSSPPPAALVTSPSPTSSVASPTHSIGKDSKEKGGSDKFPRFPRLHPRSKGYKLGKSSSSEFESDSDGYDEKEKKMTLSERGLASSSEKDLMFRSSNLVDDSKVDSQRLTSSERALSPLSVLQPSPSLHLSDSISERIAPRATEESFSEGEKVERQSIGTAVSTPSHETSGGSSMDSSASALPLLGGKQTRQARRKARQAQLQRLRMAQEIQRQLEELEVKQRLLEKRGVSVEKALRGEEKDGPLAKINLSSDGIGSGDHEDDEEDDFDEDDGEEEAKLLQEWFELMRERSELRRCERELLVRAEELSLEDRHARLQADLRDRLAQDDSTKTKSDVDREGEILGEMLEIVERRDSLIALLEEDRQRNIDPSGVIGREFTLLPEALDTS
ncbi:F-actin-monooxygenase MICAL3 isoform X2 [Ischnura elegans]|uniref:F-actin-monooxygenase MICAL3 isoform X2 n=1 Tax=Ischnura elegans TaxID=197161 RepID=UPI001ED8740A|nr:F-actin-monooxygenase MICAL3 isoform X2 [Ischnura elegans]